MRASRAGAVAKAVRPAEQLGMGLSPLSTRPNQSAKILLKKQISSGSMHTAMFG
jgi:hypothetical protein